MHIMYNYFHNRTVTPIFHFYITQVQKHHKSLFFWIKINERKYLEEIDEYFVLSICSQAFLCPSIHYSLYDLFNIAQLDHNFSY